jgi:Lrp/AsnC family transcriptional regulator
MPNAVTLDALDRKILRALQEDATVSTTDLAAKIGLSQAPCWRRIRRLEEAGVIARRAAILNRDSVGLPVLIFTTVRLATHAARTLQEFEDAIRAFPEVIECHKLMGAADHLLKIVVPSVEAYERFFREKLSQLPAVREANSAIALSEVKSTTSLPI